MEAYDNATNRYNFKQHSGEFYYQIEISDIGQYMDGKVSFKARLEHTMSKEIYYVYNFTVKATDSGYKILGAICVEYYNGTGGIDNKHYRLWKEDGEDGNYIYRYELYKDDGSTVDSRSFENQKPNIYWVDLDLLAVSFQAGTGRMTTWTYYYDTVRNMLSETFFGVAAENEKYILYYDYNSKKIVVRDRFDREKYYKEFSLKEVPCDEIEPIEDASFSLYGNSVTVEYRYFDKDSEKMMKELFLLK